ncbi:MAG: F0F1 ATP synthase subunit B [Dethiobacteria bacterium]
MDAIMEALGLDFWTFLFQFINILIILAALLFFFWKPIIKMLDSREEKIEGNLKEAASAREKAEEILASYQQKIDLAHQEAQAILERADKMAETTRSEMVVQAREEADRILEQARIEIEREKRLAMANIRGQAADLILMATSRVLARTLTSSDQEELVKEALVEVESLQ